MRAWLPTFNGNCSLAFLMAANQGTTVMIDKQAQRCEVLENVIVAHNIEISRRSRAIVEMVAKRQIIAEVRVPVLLLLFRMAMPPFQWESVHGQKVYDH